MASQNIDIIIQAKDQATKAIKNVRGSLDGLTKSGNQTNNSFTSAMSTVKKLVATYGAYRLSKGIIDLGINLEQTTIAFTTMLGSAEDAQKLLEDLTDFAKKTPFELTGIRQTAKQLLAFGFSADELIPTLKSLGDVAGGLSVPIAQVAYAYGHVRAANQLYGTELRQFVNAGVPILQELADMYGVTAAEAKKMVEDGMVSFTDVEEAFKRMTGEGGKFENLMDAQSKSLGGMLSNLKDSVVSLGESIGLALIPVFKELMVTYQPVIEQAAESLALWFSNKENIDNLVTGIQGLISTFGVLFDVAGMIINIFKLILLPFQDAINSIAALAADVTHLAWVFTNRGIPAVKSFVGNAVEKVIQLKDTFLDIFPKIKEIGVTVFSELKDEVIAKFQGIIDFASSAFDKVNALWGKVKNTANSIKEKASSAGAAVGDFIGARASGGVVTQGRPYKVGENGAEMFIPNTSGQIVPAGGAGLGGVNVSINMGGVNVSNSADEGRLVETMKRELAGVLQAYKLGVS